LKLYTAAAEYAATRGLIIADTKFEFGLIGGELILIDEALTPDSSRYWPLEGYTPGRSQPSFDKQYLRDWLTSQGFRKGLEDGSDGQGWTMSEEVVQGTQERYLNARDILLK
jgi:phosphoribosylaminoimidazole-succinocarboxamide synthase